MSHSAWTLIIVGVLIAAVGLECLAQCSDVARALIRRLTGDWFDHVPMLSLPSGNFEDHHALLETAT